MDDTFTPSSGTPPLSKKRTVGRGGGAIAATKIPGRYVLRFDASTSSNGRRVQRKRIFVGSLREARAELAKLVGGAKAGLAGNAGTMTVAKHFDDWIVWVESRNLAHATTRRYRAFVDEFIVPELGGVRLEALTAARIDLAIGTWRKQKRRDGRRGQLSERTLHHVFAVLRSGLRCAVKWGRIARNPIDAAEPPRPAKAAVAALDENKAAELLAGLRDGSLRDLYAAVVVMLTCGLRRSECLGLVWPAVDLDGAILHVERALEFVDGAPRFKKPKSGTSVRAIAMPPLTVQTLRRHRVEQKVLAIASGRPRNFNREDLVFPNPTGAPWDPEQFSSRFFWGIRSRKLPIVSVHGLRHTYATLLLRSGTNLNVAKVALGHSTVAITADTYSHVLFDQQEAAAEALGARLSAAFDRLTSTRAGGA